MIYMDAAAMLETLIKWVLGLLGVAIVGIWHMSHKLSIIGQRLSDHVIECEKLHEHHVKSFKDIYDRLEALK